MLFHAQVAEGIFLISSDISGPNSDGRSLKPGRATANSYLVVGDEKALLFDMAVNEPGLADYARSLTDRPVFPVLSHGHIDHVYHLEDFSEVWLHSGDIPLLKGKGIGTRKIKPLPVIHELADGDTIDLGGRLLDVIHIPGHTMGSILLLDRNTRVLLSGGCCMGFRGLYRWMNSAIGCGGCGTSLLIMHFPPMTAAHSPKNICAPCWMRSSTTCPMQKRNFPFPLQESCCA